MKGTNRGSRANKPKPDKAGATRLRIEQVIRAIPRGKVSTYGGIARAAGFPGAARQVAAILRRGFGFALRNNVLNGDGLGSHVRSEAFFKMKTIAYSAEEL